MAFLYNIKELNELLENFFQLINTRIVVFDDQFHEIISFPVHQTSFCKLIRTFPSLKEKCNECDKNACKKVSRLSEPYIYKCHVNLTEAIVPIKMDNKIYGFILLGQIILDEEKEQYLLRITSYLDSHNIKKEKAILAIQEQTVMSKIKLIAACKILQKNATTLIYTKAIALKKNKVADQIETYINLNLDKELSIDIICDKFNISKSRLCSISKADYGIGIAKYIRLARVQKAKELLLDTDTTIYLIAIKIGINDYNYFTKVFKSITGLTPSEYRKNGYNL